MDYQQLRTEWVPTPSASLPFSQISVRTDRQRRQKLNRMAALPHTGENVTRIFLLLGIGDHWEHSILEALFWEEWRSEEIGKVLRLNYNLLGMTKTCPQILNDELHSSFRGNRVYTFTRYWASVSFMEWGWQKSILKVLKYETKLCSTQWALVECQPPCPPGTAQAPRLLILAMTRERAVYNTISKKTNWDRSLGLNVLTNCHSMCWIYMEIKG